MFDTTSRDIDHALGLYDTLQRQPTNLRSPHANVLEIVLRTWIDEQRLNPAQVEWRSGLK